MDSPFTITPSSSSASLPIQKDYMLDSTSDILSSAPSSPSSSPTSFRSRSPSSAKPEPESPTINGHLAPPPASPRWRTISRSPSPLGLIPIHRSWAALIHRHEVPRKLLHVSIGFLVVYLYKHGAQPSQITPALTSVLVPIASADLLRFYSPRFNAFYIRCLGALMRESEVTGWNGVVWYLVGTIIVLSVFPKDVATLSILLLSWCDTAASTFGRAWGRYTPRVRKGKSLAGCLASFVVGAVTAAVWWGSIVPSTPAWENDPAGAKMWQGTLGAPGIEVAGGWALGLMAVATGVIASVSEAMDCWGMDDNIVIPIVSAVGVWGVLKVFG